MKCNKCGFEWNTKQDIIDKLKEEWISQHKDKYSFDMFNHMLDRKIEYWNKIIKPFGYKNKTYNDVCFICGNNLHTNKTKVYNDRYVKRRIRYKYSNRNKYTYVDNDFLLKILKDNKESAKHRIICMRQQR